MGASRVWLITGASSGLGRALAEAALEQGDRVVATARDPGTVADLEDRYRGRAIRVTIVDAPGPVRTDFAAGATVTPPSSDDYADSVGRALEWFEGVAGRPTQRPGPRRGGDRRGRRGRRPRAPAGAGRRGWEAVRQALDGRRRELDAWEALSISAAIAGA